MFPGQPANLVTVLCTQIDSDGNAWRHQGGMAAVVTRHHALVAAAVQPRGGLLAQVAGQAHGVTAVFPSATAAVDAALFLQRALAREAWPDGSSLRARLALHTGEAGDGGGAVTEHALHLLATAHGGQTLLSDVAAEQVHDALPDGAGLKGLGPHRLRDLTSSEEVFALLHPGLPADFPPLRSLDAFPHNLPVQLTRFIGRRREMADVEERLVQTHLLTLTGAGGSGKTRLALQVGADLLGAYRDGVWLVELASLADPSLVPQGIASVLNLREERNRPVLHTLVDYCKPRQMLLVLDNCEHLIAACATAAEALLRACPNLRVLTTSREPLGVAGEVTWPVPSLSLPERGLLPPIDTLLHYESVRLFVERAAAMQPGFSLTSQNAPAVVQVCQRLDGIPLAVELAAARVKVLSVEQIADRLDDRFQLLTAGSRTAMPRHRTLRGTMDWSHDLLSEQERTLWRRLSVFAGGFTLAAAESVCAGGSIAGAQVLALLSQLVDKSLVAAEDQGQEKFYKCPETIRQYGAEKLRESGEEAGLRQRHRDWYLALIEGVAPKLQGPEQGAWLQRLEQEHDNLRAALHWSRQPAEREAALRLVAGLWWFWYVRGHIGEGSSWLEAVLAEAKAPVPARAEALRGAGMLAREQGDYDRAEALGEESLALSRQLGDLASVSKSLNNLGIVALGRGRYDRAESLYLESLAIVRAFGNQYGMARALGNLGYAALELEQYDKAHERFAESLRLSRAIGDTQSLAMTLNFLGLVDQRQGNPDRAEQRHREALELARQLGDNRTIARVLFSLGGLALAQNDGSGARALLGECLVLRQQLLDREGAVACLEALAGLAGRQGQPVRAARLLGAAAALRLEIGAPVPPDDEALVQTSTAAARGVLGPEAFAVEWAQGQRLTLDQAIAYALAEPVAVQPPVAASRSASTLAALDRLTVRELQIAGLVARGLTAKEIGARLHLSPRTVEKHEENIRAKLQVPNRAALAAWGVTSGLASSDSR